MENVTSPSDEAQAVIIAAFVVAVGILVLAALLNGLIFSQDLATREDGADARVVLEFTQDTEKAVSLAMTGNRTTPGDAEDEFDEFLQEYERDLLARYTSRQRAVSLGPDPTEFSNPDVDGNLSWALGQRCGVSLPSGSGACDFTDETGTTDWLILNDSEAFDDGSPYKMEFNVTQPTGPSDEFVINITDSSGTFPPGPPLGLGWRMNVTNSGVGFQENSGPSGLIDPKSYSWSDIGEDYARIEVMNESINGQSVLNGSTVDTKKNLISGLEQMNFESGDDVEGTYDIRIDKDTPISDIEGPCNNTSDVCRLVEHGDNRDLYQVGVVNDVSGIRANYTDKDITNSAEIDLTLEQEDLILEER